MSYLLIEKSKSQVIHCPEGGINHLGHQFEVQVFFSSQLWLVIDISVNFYKRTYEQIPERLLFISVKFL